MRASLLFALVVWLVGCGPGPPAAVQPKSERAPTPTTGEPERPKSLAEQIEQLRRAKLLLAQFDQEIEQAKAAEEKFRQAAALQAKIDEALKKSSSPDTAKALDNFRLNLARLEKKRAELESEFGETIERLLKTGEERLAAGEEKRLEIPPPIERWLNSLPTPGGAGAKPGT